MKKVIFVSLILMSVFAYAQTSITKTLTDFSELKVYNGIDVELIKSDKQQIEIEGEKAEKVRVKQKGNTLKIALKFPQTLSKGKVAVRLFYNKPIVVIDANEGATITGKDFNQPKLTAKTQEGAFINLVAKVTNLKVKASSGGVLKLTGTAENQTVDVDLGGVYHGYKMEVANMSAVRAGSGAKAEINTITTLDAKVTFGGSIYYKGNPELIKDSKVVGGIIEKRN